MKDLLIHATPGSLRARWADTSGWQGDAVTLVLPGAGSLGAALQDLINGGFRPARAAIAGASLLSSQELKRVLGCEVLVIDPARALLAAAPDCAPVQLGGAASASGPELALLPGDSLHAAVRMPAPEARDVVFESMAGDSDLAPGSHLDAELWTLLAQAHGHVSRNTVLSEPGLRRLYSTLAGLWGGGGDVPPVADIVERGCDMADPLCHQVLETYAGLLGSAAGALAITFGATGGVYLGGPLLAGMSGMLAGGPLRRRFDERGDRSTLAAGIPVWLFEDPDAPLLGAHRCLVEALPAAARASD